MKRTRTLDLSLRGPCFASTQKAADIVQASEITSKFARTESYSLRVRGVFFARKT